MADHLWCCRLIGRDQIIQRHHGTGVGTNIELLHVLGFRTELLVSLHVDAIRTVIEIEIVHVGRAHVHAQRVGDLRKGHVQTLRLFAVDGHQILRIVRRKRSVESHQFFMLSRLLHQSMRRGGQLFQLVRALVLDDKLEAAELP